MSGWLRRLACRWLDLVTAEDLRRATLAVEALWAQERISSRAEIERLRRALGAARQGGRGGPAPAAGAAERHVRRSVQTRPAAGAQLKEGDQ